MMPRSRETEILDQWRAVANARTKPERAPRPSRIGFPLGMGLVALTVLVAFVVVAARNNDASSKSTAPGATTPAAVATPLTPSPSQAIVGARPSSTALLSPPSLPAAGGSCSADQIVALKATSAYSFSTFLTRSVFVTQPLRNKGQDCVLELPRRIGLVPAAGSVHSIMVTNTADTTSWTLRSGRSLSIVLGDWWYDPRLLAETRFTPPPCAEAIHDVTRAALPLASGQIEITWETSWQDVCLSPSTVSVSVQQDVP